MTLFAGAAPDTEILITACASISIATLIQQRSLASQRLNHRKFLSSHFARLNMFGLLAAPLHHLPRI